MSPWVAGQRRSASCSMIRRGAEQAAACAEGDIRAYGVMDLSPWPGGLFIQVAMTSGNIGAEHACPVGGEALGDTCTEAVAVGEQPRCEVPAEGEPERCDPLGICQPPVHRGLHALEEVGGGAAAQVFEEHGAKSSP